jgi:hypothetical protein
MWRSKVASSGSAVEWPVNSGLVAAAAVGRAAQLLRAHAVGRVAVRADDVQRRRFGHAQKLGARRGELQGRPPARASFATLRACDSRAFLPCRRSLSNGPATCCTCCPSALCVARGARAVRGRPAPRQGRDLPRAGPAGAGWHHAGEPGAARCVDRAACAAAHSCFWAISCTRRRRAPCSPRVEAWRAHARGRCDDAGARQPRQPRGRSAGTLGIEVVNEPFLLGPFACCHHPQSHATHFVLAGHLLVGQLVGIGFASASGKCCTSSADTSDSACVSPSSKRPSRNALPMRCADLAHSCGVDARSCRGRPRSRSRARPAAGRPARRCCARCPTRAACRTSRRRARAACASRHR